MILKIFLIISYLLLVISLCKDEKGITNSEYNEL